MMPVITIILLRLRRIAMPLPTAVMAEPHIVAIAILLSLMAVILIMTLVWLFVRKYVLGLSQPKVTENEALSLSLASQQKQSEIAPSTQSLGASVYPDGSQATGATSGATNPELRSPKRRSSGVVRRPGPGTGPADDAGQDHSKVKKPGADAAPAKDGATETTKASSLSSAPAGRRTSSHSRRSTSDCRATKKRGRHKTDRKHAVMREPRATDAVARGERQSVLRGDNDVKLRAPAKATPTTGPVVKKLSDKDAMYLPPASSAQLDRMTDTCDSHASRRHTKSKKTRAKCDAKSSRSVVVTTRKHKPNPDLWPKQVTEDAGEDRPSADAGQPTAAPPPFAHSQQRTSTRSKGSHKSSSKTSVGKPLRRSSEAMPVPSSWSRKPDGSGAPAATPNLSLREASTQEQYGGEVKDAHTPALLAPGLDVSAREPSSPTETAVRTEARAIPPVMPSLTIFSSDHSVPVPFTPAWYSPILKDRPLMPREEMPVQSTNQNFNIFSLER